MFTVTVCPVAGDGIVEGGSMNGDRILGWVLRQTDEQRGYQKEEDCKRE